jgi:hypothetical protein
MPSALAIAPVLDPLLMARSTSRSRGESVSIAVTELRAGFADSIFDYLGSVN